MFRVNTALSHTGPKASMAKAVDKVESIPIAASDMPT
jgi:hypothetical protein